MEWMLVCEVQLAISDYAICQVRGGNLELPDVVVQQKKKLPASRTGEVSTSVSAITQRR